MATNNPIAVAKNSSGPVRSTPGAHQILGRVAGGGAHAVTVETKLKSILSAIVVNETDGAIVVPTIAASTLYPGTEKATFTVANAKTYSYIITGLLHVAATVDTTGGATTIIYEPIKGR